MQVISSSIMVLQTNMMTCREISDQMSLQALAGFSTNPPSAFGDI